MGVPHPLVGDRWFRTPEGRAALAGMARSARASLDSGSDFDFALAAGPGPAAAPGDFGISTGYQLKPLVRADGAEALLYLRNFAGVEAWDPANRFFVRARKPAALRITVRLGGRFTADFWDLDTGTHETRNVAAGQGLDLGTSDHDFAVLLRRAGQ